MRLSRDIDLGRSLRQVFGNRPSAEERIRIDQERQDQTAEEILKRFFNPKPEHVCEIQLLADEVGLGKTFVALAVAVTILDQIRSGTPPPGLPANKPVVLVLTPNNDALFNKWLREADTFKTECARRHDALDWLQVKKPRNEGSGSGNIVDLRAAMGEATRDKPVLLIAKQTSLGAALTDRDKWRMRALASAFGYFRMHTKIRRYWCRRGKVFERYGIPDLQILINLRLSAGLWENENSIDLQRAYERALDDNKDYLRDHLRQALNGTDEDEVVRWLDDFTRQAIAGDFPRLPLMVIDEVHGLKNPQCQARKNLHSFLDGKACRLLGLSATPFQLRHEELLSVLRLRGLLRMPSTRADQLRSAVSRLEEAMKDARSGGDRFRDRWSRLRAGDREAVHHAWDELEELPHDAAVERTGALQPTRIGNALEAALLLKRCNKDLERRLGPFVIRHRHNRNDREHFVGMKSTPGNGPGTLHFGWVPGLEVKGGSELAHYLLMRAVALAKDEK